AAGTASTACQSNLGRLAVALEPFPAANLRLVERHGPTEPAFVRGHSGVVLDAADDEAALDPEQVERRHPDHLHPERGAGVDQGVPQLDCTRTVDPPLVGELGGVA